jgi:ketosteroid isomerase-like protein
MTEGATSARSGTQLETKAEIAQLFYAYAYHFDRNEPEAVAALFTSDATIDYGPEVAPIQGRDAIVPRISPGLDEIFTATSHHISNVSVRLAGEETATGMAYVYAWHRYRDGSPDGHLWGQYHNRFRRTRDGWRISGLRLEAAGTSYFHRASMHSIGRRTTGGTSTA